MPSYKSFLYLFSRIAIAIIAIGSLVVWFGLLNPENPSAKRAIIATFLFFYLLIPIVLWNSAKWKNLLKDKRNLYLLSFTGLLPIFAVLEMYDYGVYSLRFLLTTIFAIIVFVYMLFIVIKESKADKLSEA